MDEVMLVKGRTLESTLLAMTSRWWGHQRVVCWLWTKVHYGLLLRHIGWTAEWLGQGNEGRGGKREWRCGGWGYSGGREKRWGSSASQWEQSEISISLTAACVHSSPRLASHIRSILTIWVWSLRSSDPPKVMLFYLWNGCVCENVNAQQRVKQASLSTSSLWALARKHFHSV